MCGGIVQGTAESAELETDCNEVTFLFGSTISSSLLTLSDFCHHLAPPTSSASGSPQLDIELIYSSISVPERIFSSHLLPRKTNIRTWPATDSLLFVLVRSINILE
jgi:hypothetical protein